MTSITSGQRKQFRRLFEDTLEKAGLDKAGAQIILGKGDEFQDNILAFVRKQAISTWKTIKLGTGLKTADDFRKAIKAKGMKIGNWANDILGKSAFVAAKGETEIDLVLVTVAELGFKSGARYDQICGRAKELGLEFCPSEVGPQLRLQYEDQPEGEWVLIGMEPLSDSDGHLRVFDVEHGGGGRRLRGGVGGPGCFWGGRGRWVFVRPRRK